MSLSLKVVLLLGVLVCAATAARPGRGRNLKRQQAEDARDARSLLTAFPFSEIGNTGGRGHHGAHGAHGAHGEGHHGEHDRLGVGRQAGDSSPAIDLGVIAAAEVGPDGKRCINKVVTVDELEYEDHIECQHSYSKRCSITYITDYESQQEEECEENFRKNCFIEYNKAAFNETVNFCYTPTVKDCGAGPEECRTVYESECETSYKVHEVEDDIPECYEDKQSKCEDVTVGYTTKQECDVWPVQVCNLAKKKVLKHTPDTKCRKVPKEICAPAGCNLIPGEEQCQERTKTVITDVPEENCSLEPQKTCKHVTKLVPILKPEETCVDVPKEVCQRSRKNPRKVKKPVMKKWCYVPSPESGLA